MIDIILKLTEIEDFFQGLTLKVLRLDPNLPTNQSKVRISWPAGGAPAWKRTEDVIFLMINNQDDPINQQQDVSYSSQDSTNAKRSVGYTRVHRVDFVLYGPNSYDNAEKIKRSLYLPEFKELMQKSNLALVFNSNIPRRVPENFNGQWWERSDYYAVFNEKVTINSTVPYLQSANVQIKESR